jgi:predicted SprT family Zn-dependent metalloprotease
VNALSVDEEWEDSLKVFGAEAAEDKQYEILIAKTIQRLPKDVRDELRLDEEDPSVRLSTIRRTDLSMPFILLNFANMQGMSEEEVMSVIAHEIAHFILGHSSSIYDTGRYKEKEADDREVGIQKNLGQNMM